MVRETQTDNGKLAGNRYHAGMDSPRGSGLYAIPFIGLLLLLLLFATCPALADKPSETTPRQSASADTLTDNKQDLMQAGFDYLNKDEDRHAYRCGKRLLTLGEQDGDRAFAQLYGHLLMGLAGIDSEQGTHSYAHLESARALAERYHNYEALMQALKGFGNYALFVNDDAYSAITYYMQALEEAKRVNNRKLYAMLLNNLSGAYFVQGDMTGKRYAEEAVRIAQEIHEQVPLFFGTCNMAFYCLATDSLQEAARCIEAIEQMHARLGYGTLTDIYLTKAEYYEKMKNLDRAYRYYAMAMENFPTASPSSITMTYLKYARTLRSNHYATSAIKVLEYALYHIDQSEVPIHKSPILKELSLCYREAHLPDSALAYALRYIERQDQRFDETRERAMQEARIRHDIYSREQQISEQQTVILNKRYQVAILTGILSVLFIALVLTAFFFRKKRRLYKAIVRQNSEYMQHEQLLMAQIEQLRSGTQATTVPTDKLRELMTRFTSLMMETKLYTDPTLTLASVAERLDTNRTYLSKAINEITGKTFTQQLSEYRMRHVIAEISDMESDKPLKQIAAEAGFTSLSTFYAVFQASTGMAPARYRAQLRAINPQN